MTGPVHFVYLGGGWCWQFTRAMRTARVHGGEIWLWATDDLKGRYGDMSDLPEFVMKPLELPRWLREHPIKLANVKDVIVYDLLYDHGGMYLDLDTISLRSAWDLLTADVCMSREFPPGEEAGEPFNTAVLIARRESTILNDLYWEATRLLSAGEDTWGAIGPHLISHFARREPQWFSPAPFGALNGWSYHSIGDYYDNPRDPGAPCRVIHLYSSDHLGQFYADRWMP